MISLVPGYDTVPHFSGARYGSLDFTPTYGLAESHPLLEKAVVFGGVPLCAYVAFTKKGPAAVAVGALGVGIFWLWLQGNLGRGSVDWSFLNPSAPVYLEAP